MQLALFIIFGLLAVIFGFNLLLQKHPINSALSLIVVMMSLAVLYWSLGAEFLGAAQDVAVEPDRVVVVVGLDDQPHLQDAAGRRRHRGVGR